MRRGEVWRIPALRGTAHVAVVSADAALPVLGAPIVARIAPTVGGIPLDGDEPPPSVWVIPLGPGDPLEGWLLAYSQYQPAASRYADGERLGTLGRATMARVTAALTELFAL